MRWGCVLSLSLSLNSIFNAVGMRFILITEQHFIGGFVLSNTGLVSPLGVRFMLIQYGSLFIQ